MSRLVPAAARRLYRYSRWIGLKEAWCFVAFDFIKRRTLRPVTIASQRLYLRTSTSDLPIAIGALITGEYEGIRCPKPSVVVDAGAHIGASAVYFATKYPTATVFAIEPELENYKILEANTRASKNIVPIRAALWGEEAVKPILDRFHGPCGYSIADTPNMTASTGQDVQCVTVDSLMRTHALRSIDILKIDIEGAEKSVFENSRQWINKVRVIAIELHDRICMGSARAFYSATSEYAMFVKSGEKVVAYRS